MDVISRGDCNIDDENVILYATEDDEKRVSIHVLEKISYLGLLKMDNPRCPTTRSTTLRLIPLSIVKDISFKSEENKDSHVIEDESISNKIKSLPELTISYLKKLLKFDENLPYLIARATTNQEKEAVIKALCEKDNDGLTGLMMVARYAPDAFSSLIETGKKEAVIVLDQEKLLNPTSFKAVIALDQEGLLDNNNFNLIKEIIEHTKGIQNEIYINYF